MNEGLYFLLIWNLITIYMTHISQTITDKINIILLKENLILINNFKTQIFFNKVTILSLICIALIYNIFFIE